MIAFLLLAMTAQCGPSGCPAPARYMPTYAPSAPLVVHQQPQPAYAWHRTKHNGLSFQVWGFVNSEGMIEWNPELKENRSAYWQADKLAQAAKPQTAPVKPKAAKQESLPVNYGVDPTQRQSGERYTVNSAEAQSFVVQAQAASEGKSDRIYLTVIGSPEDRKQIAIDWRDSPSFKEWHDKVWFQEFVKGDWQVKDELGYAAKGKPTVLVQRPGGGVVLRTTSYSGPAPILAALRKADPTYHPSDDPGSDDSDESTVSHRTILAIMAIVAAAVIFIPRKRA